MKSAAKKPSRWFYALGVMVIVLAFAGIATYGATQTDKVVPNTRVVVPGTHELELDHRGRYTIFYEYRSVVDGCSYSTPGYNSWISVSLTAKDSSQPVDLSEPSQNSIYRGNRYEGMSVWDFRIEEPGTYIFAAGYDEGRTGPDVVYALGQTNPALFGITAFALAVVGFGFMVIGVCIIVITFVRRRTPTKRTGTVSAPDTDAT